MKVNIVHRFRHPLLACGFMFIPSINSKPISDMYQNNNMPVLAQQLDRDTFELEITPFGTNSPAVLKVAPNPNLYVKNELKTAKIVVDLSKNVLYKYNDNGEAEKAFLIASGKPRTPTDVGVRVVTHIENYPYRSAPAGTKRRRNPKDYGPKIICLETLDPKTGLRGKTGEFIHGNNNPESIGKYVSKGCMRMDNEVIKELSQQVKRGDIVIIQR